MGKRWKSEPYSGYYRGYKYRGTKVLLILAVIFVLLYMCVHSIWLALAWIVGINIFSLGDMINDKQISRGRTQDSRTPNNQFYTEAVLGGWPGLLLARNTENHKTKKQNFKEIIGGCIIINVILGCLFYVNFVYFSITFFVMCFIIVGILMKEGKN